MYWVNYSLKRIKSPVSNEPYKKKINHTSNLIYTKKKKNTSNLLFFWYKYLWSKSGWCPVWATDKFHFSEKKKKTINIYNWPNGKLYDNNYIYIYKK